MIRIYVGNLNFQTTEESLNELFSEHGTVNNVSIITDRVTGRSRGFGFVEMGEDSEARAAMDALNGRELDDRTLKISEARSRGEESRGAGRH